ncbi:hypothetical protein DFQ13_104240 [Actinokineospora spheciospongiae]|nr:hypothetical protein DFQ13_104240 [Actinokineospora spheciospongiae]
MTRGGVAGTRLTRVGLRGVLRPRVLQTRVGAAGGSVGAIFAHGLGGGGS